MKQTSFRSLFCRFAVLFLVVGALTASFAADEEVELKDAAGNTVIRYIVDAPEGLASADTTDPTKQVGLVLTFPEHDTAVNSNSHSVRQALWRMGMSDDYVVIAGAPQTRKFGLEDHEPITKLIEWAKKTYPINPRRVYMFGKGEGAKVSTEFVSLHPDLIAGAVTNSWGAWVLAPEIDKAFDYANDQPEIYMVLGHRDLSHHLTTVRDTYSRLRAKGYNMIYREFEDMRDFSYYPVSNDDSVAWLTRLRNKRLPLSSQEQQLLKKFSGSSVPAPNSDGYYGDLAVVGGAQAGAVLVQLLDSKDAKVRAAAAKTFNYGFFGETAIAALAKKASDSSDKVRRTAVRALAINANWRSQTAQKTLINLAKDTTLPTDQRMDAVDGLGYAIRYQVEGFQQDPAMFAALVSLLEEDGGGAIRDAAVTLLGATFEPLPIERNGRPSLTRSPVGGWERWIEEITAKAAGPMHAYHVCGGTGLEKAAELFCSGGKELKKNPAAGFKLTMQAAEAGYVPAQMMTGMLYANGKGVKQDYDAAVKWFIKAAEAGDIQSASYASMALKSGQTATRDRELTAKWTAYVEEHAPQLPH